MTLKQKILFIPVSSKKGIGEYMRSTIIATFLVEQNPNVDIHFILNENAPYISDCKFNVHLVSGTPTKCTESVKEIIHEIKPSVVLFDASGRSEQYKYAKNLGARVAFISQHPIKRTKGLSLRRIAHIDKHWVSQPEFTMTNLTLWQQVKLKIFNKPHPEYLGTLYMPLTEDSKMSTLQSYNVKANEYILINAGSGGHKLNGKPAVDMFAEIARYIEETYQFKTLVVYGASYQQPIPTPTSMNLPIKSLSNSEFMALLSGAKAAMLSGGGSILQAISLQVPSVAVPVAKDQPNRIEGCVNKQLVIASEANIIAFKKAVDQLFNPKKYLELSKQLENVHLENGVLIVVRQINSWLSE